MLRQGSGVIIHIIDPTDTSTAREQSMKSLGGIPLGRPGWPAEVAELVVRGRRSGRVISLPLVMAVVEGERSMLGDDVNWVRNVRAAGGNVTLRHGRREDVRLEEVAADRGEL